MEDDEKNNLQIPEDPQRKTEETWEAEEDWSYIWPYLAIYGHLVYWTKGTNIGKWGIPEKSYENVAQQW